MKSNYKNIVPLRFLYNVLELMEIDIHVFMNDLQANNASALLVYKSIDKVYRDDAAINTTETLEYEYWSN